MTWGARRGVTLIETLIVLALIALLASVAVLNAPAIRSGARDDAEVFAARLDAATDLALISGAPVRVELSSAESVFSSFDDGAWRALESPRVLRRRAFHRDVAVTLLSFDAALTDADAPKGERDDVRRFLIDPVGGAGATSIAFADSRGRWVVSLDASGKPKVARDGT